MRSVSYAIATYDVPCVMFFRSALLIAVRQIGICTAPSCPLYRGLSAKLTGGCIDKQFYRKNETIANLHKPPASAALRQPPVEGARGGAVSNHPRSGYLHCQLSIINCQFKAKSRFFGLPVSAAGGGLWCTGTPGSPPERIRGACRARETGSAPEGPAPG